MSLFLSHARQQKLGSACELSTIEYRTSISSHMASYSDHAVPHLRFDRRRCRVQFGLLSIRGQHAVCCNVVVRQLPLLFPTIPPPEPYERIRHFTFPCGEELATRIAKDPKLSNIISIMSLDLGTMPTHFGRRAGFLICVVTTSVTMPVPLAIIWRIRVQFIGLFLFSPRASSLIHSLTSQQSAAARARIEFYISVNVHSIFNFPQGSYK